MNEAVKARPRKSNAPPIQGEGDRSAWILSNAASLIASKGFHHMSMRDVSRATGYSLAGLYHYFEHKDDLLFQIQLRFFSTVVQEQERITATLEPVEQQLRALVSNHLGFFAQHADELKVCTYELYSLTGEPFEQVAIIRRRYFALMARVVGELLGIDEPDSVRVRHVTLFLFGALNWIFMWYDPAKDGPADKLGSELCDLVLNGVGTRPSQPERQLKQRRKSS